MKQKVGYFLFLLIGAFIFGALVVQYFSPTRVTHKTVAGVRAPKPTISLITHAATISVTPTPIKLSKNTYVIAAYGDSMIDTMGENLEHLDAALKEKYGGHVSFKLYNYGIGATNLENGLSRWDSNFVNRKRSFPSISSLHPDVIILGSYSYNPFSPFDPEKQKQLLTQLIEKAKGTGAGVYVLDEIAPLYDGFGMGPKGPNLSTESAHLQAQNILTQLKNVPSVVKKEGVGLIDILRYTQTHGEYGNRYYTNPDDGIHPSDYGQVFTAEKIVGAIVLK